MGGSKMKDNKLTDKELDYFEAKAGSDTILIKALELIKMVQSNPAIETFIAIKKSHTELCEELTAKGVKLFNSDNDSVKDFDNFQKFKITALDTVNMINSLKKQLTAEEEAKAISKIKNSPQLFFEKQFKKGKKDEVVN